MKFETTDLRLRPDLAFPESGRYVAPGALQPVVIDRERNLGRCDDPNVWMSHPVRQGSGTPNPWASTWFR